MENKMRPKDKKHKYQKVYKVSNVSIRGFFEDHRFLSNYHLCTIWYKGREYPSTENAYQAAKFPDNLRSQFQNIDPVEARRLGKVLKMSKDDTDIWESKRIGVMAEIIMYKFSTDIVLRKKLLATRGLRLIEENYWGDTFWGIYKSKGTNHLGNILMKVRSYWAEWE